MGKNILDRIDEYILNGCQNFSDLMHDWCNVNNFFLARISLVIYIIAALGYQCADYILYGYAGIFIFHCIISLIIFSIFWGIARVFESLTLNTEIDVNPISDAFGKYRSLLLLFTFSMVCICTTALFDIPIKLSSKERDMYIINEILIMVNDSAFLAMIYFLSCKKRQRKKNKWKELKEKLSEKIDSLFPKPEPAFIRVK